MRTIGIIGGMGPLATVDLYAKIVYAAQGKKIETMCPCFSADGRISRTGCFHLRNRSKRPACSSGRSPAAGTGGSRCAVPGMQYGTFLL